MRSINSKQYRDQVRAHYNHVSKCDDHHSHIQKVVQIEPGNCSCPDYSERINKIKGDITNIKKDITDINGYISDIYIKIEALVDRIDNLQPSQGTGTEETITLSLSTPTAGIVRSTDTSPNTVAFDSLLADVEEWDAGKMNKFYADFISPVIAQNGYNLLEPIPVSALCSCTRIPPTELSEVTTWDDLEGDEFIENKRAYIMQFILANRSNSTRAMYLTNQLIGAFALPL